MRALLLGWLLVLGLSACGDGLGPPCDRIGSRSECGIDEVCARYEGDGYCQERCDRNDDCGFGERCRDVSDTDDRACIPTDDDDDDDDFLR